MSADDRRPQDPDPLAGHLRDALAAPDGVPDGLVEATLAAVRATRQDHPLPRLGILAAAAAVLAVAFVGALAIRIPRDAGPTGTAAPSTAIASPGTPTPDATAPSTSPMAGDFPATVLGLDVVSVSDALAVRDAPVGPGTPVPLAVRGWYSSLGPIHCRYGGPLDELETSCPADVVWLMEEPEDLFTVTENSSGGRAPAGPALNPRFVGGVVAPEVPSGRAVGRNLDPPPVPVVLVGHWNDGRAAYCTAAGMAECARAFVVDGVAWVQGAAVAPMALTGTNRTPTLTAEAVVDRAEAALPGWTVASLAVYPHDELRAVDPRLLDRDVPVAGDLTWVARMIRRGEEPVTLLVSDLDGSTARLPAWPVWGPVVDGLDGETARLPSVAVAHADCDGRTWVGGILAWSDGPTIRVVGTDDMRLATFAGTRLLARRVDGEVTLVQATGHVVVTPGWHTYIVCNVLTGSGLLGAIVEIDGEPLPTYQLTCGPLDRETCLRRAAELEAVVAEQHAGRTLISLAFSGPCGSYDALLDDNTGFSLDAYCLAPSPSPSSEPLPYLGTSWSTCLTADPGSCPGIVEAVRRLDPVAFARAARVVVTTSPGDRCPLELRCSLLATTNVILVPPGWKGRAQDLVVWKAAREGFARKVDRPGDEFARAVVLGGTTQHCGPLRGHACSVAIASVGETLMKAHPGRIVTSITLEGACRYRATLDGTEEVEGTMDARLCSMAAEATPPLPTVSW